jgi:hypothetical protein
MRYASTVGTVPADSTGNAPAYLVATAQEGINKMSTTVTEQSADWETGCVVFVAEDLATEFFKAEQHWDRYRQLNITVRWLKSLPEPRGAVMARAIAGPGALTITTGRLETTKSSVAHSPLNWGCRDCGRLATRPAMQPPPYPGPPVAEWLPNR